MRPRSLSKAKEGIQEGIRLFSSFSSEFSPIARLQLASVENDSEHLLLDDFNATTLHGVMTEADIYKFRQTERAIGWLAAADLAKISNDKGELPIDLFHGAADPDDSDRIRGVMEMYMRYSGTPRMDAEVNVDAIVGRYYSKSNRDLNRILQFACVAANAVRPAIKLSTTHPDANDYALDKLLNASTEVKALREAVDYTVAMKRANVKKSGVATDMSLYKLEVVDEACRDEGVANCEEYTYMSMHYAVKHQFDVPVQHVSILNGDHVFALFDRAPGSDINVPESWGPSAVVCDAFIGDVYPAVELKHRLLSLRYIDIRGGANSRESINVPTQFNPRFHRLKSGMMIDNQCQPDDDDSIKLGPKQ